MKGFSLPACLMSSTGLRRSSDPSERLTRKGMLVFAFKYGALYHSFSKMMEIIPR